MSFSAARQRRIYRAKLLHRKDPLGPAFNLNLVWAQRMLQLSAAVCDENCDVRMVPVAFHDASTPRKLCKSAPPEAVQAYKEAMKQRNLNALARQALEDLQRERGGSTAGSPPLSTCSLTAATPTGKCSVVFRQTPP